MRTGGTSQPKMPPIGVVSFRDKPEPWQAGLGVSVWPKAANAQTRFPRAPLLRVAEGELVDWRARTANRPRRPLISGFRRLAAHVHVHVRECARRVRLPGPDMQLVERRQAVAVGRAGVAEQMVFERGRTLGRDVLDGDQRQLAVR